MPEDEDDLMPTNNVDMPLSIEQREDLAREIYWLLKEHNMWENVAIYFNGFCWDSNPKKRKNSISRYGEDAFVSYANPKDYFYFVRNPNILSMTFQDSLLCEELNETKGEVYQKFDEILKRYGLCYALGYPFDLSCYKNY